MDGKLKPLPRFIHLHFFYVKSSWGTAILERFCVFTVIALLSQWQSGSLALSPIGPQV